LEKEAVLEKESQKSLPLYEQIRRRLRQSIESQSVKVGQRLPTISALVKELKVDARTVRSALNHLEKDGLISRVPHKGAVVTRSVTPKSAIAAVWSTQSDFRIIKMQEGIRQYAQLNNLDFRIFLSPHGHEQTLTLLDNIEKCNVDGVIVLPFENEDYAAVLKKLIQSNFPLVCVRAIGGLPINSVETDSFSSGYQATHYLIDKYHAPVHYLSCPLDEDPARDRYAGYAKAMADAGYSQSAIETYSHFQDIRLDDPEYWPLDKNWLPGFSGAEKLFSRIELPAGIVCANDYMAKGVYEAAAKHHLVIGRDLRVVGIDDLPLAKLLNPPLTTINSPKEEIGYEAAKLLHGLIRDKNQPLMHIHLPVELIIRESA
jgi:DNA-binding LacI/PurR family transcriptional regulator